MHCGAGLVCFALLGSLGLLPLGKAGDTSDSSLTVSKCDSATEKSLDIFLCQHGRPGDLAKQTNNTMCYAGSISSHYLPIDVDCFFTYYHWTSTKSGVITMYYAWKNGTITNSSHVMYEKCGTVIVPDKKLAMQFVTFYYHKYAVVSMCSTDENAQSGKGVSMSKIVKDYKVTSEDNNDMRKTLDFLGWGPNNLNDYTNKCLSVLE